MLDVYICLEGDYAKCMLWRGMHAWCLQRIDWGVKDGCHSLLACVASYWVDQSIWDWSLALVDSFTCIWIGLYIQYSLS